MKRVVAAGVRLALYGVAALLIAVAVILTVARLALPAVDGYRAQVEDWVSGYIGRPVRIAAMDARLLGFSPTLIFKDVGLLDPGGQRTVARFSEARISLDLFASAVEGRLITGELTVVGITLVVERRSDGGFQVQGLALPSGERNGAGGDLGAWLLSQRGLVVRDSRLIWRETGPGKASLVFDSVDLELRNDGTRHQLNGSVRLPAELGQKIEIALDVDGNVLQPRAWRGSFYMAGSGLRPARLVPVALAKGVEIKGGEADLRLWGRWSDGELVDLQGESSLRRMSLAGGDGTFSLDHGSTRFYWQRRGRGWALDLDRFILEREGHRWKPARLRLEQLDAGRAMRFAANYLRLDDLVAAANLVPFGSPEQRRMLRVMAPSGELRALALELRPGGGLRGLLAFQDLAVTPWGRLPGVKGLAGRLYLAGTDGVMQLDSRGATLELPHLFRQPLRLASLGGGLAVHRGAQGWSVAAHGLHAANDDISARLAMNLYLPEAGSPFLDLRGAFRDGRAAGVSRYLPVGIMPKQTVAWLDQAFTEGRVVSGGVLYHGRFADFPFRKGEGRFQVGFTARDLGLHYRDGWPPLQSVEGEVAFEGEGLTVKASSARMLDSRLGPVTVAIPNLRRAVLRVRGESRGPFSDVLRLLADTPLAGRFREASAQFEGTGAAELGLDFRLPLGRARGAGDHLSVNGTLAFKDAGLRVAKGIELKGIAGKLGFTERGAEGSGITAELFGEPVSVTVFTQGRGAKAETMVAARGSARGNVLAAALEWPFLSRLDGKADWQASLVVPREDNGKGTVLQVSSDLIGMAVRLPPPLAKDADGERILSVTDYLTGPRKGQLGVIYGHRLGAALELKDGNAVLRRGTVHFGAEPPVLPAGDELHLTGVLENVDLSAWGAAMARLQGTKGRGTHPLPWVVDMERLHLAPVGENGGAKPDLSRLPALSVQVRQFGYADIALGRLGFNIASAGRRMGIRDILVTGPALDLRGQGYWDRGAGRTQLTLKLHSTNFGKMMAGLGFASVISKGKADVDGQIQWAGSPADFSLEHLDGNVQVQIKDGAIEDVQPGAGRLLGLFSLEALPRRLFLDFSDLFKKDLAFKVAKGNLRLEKGNAYTKDLHLEAAPATVFVTGRTGLVRRDFDQIVTVIPDVAGSLPVAGWLAWGPQVGAALLVFQRLFKKEIDRVAEYQYRITGTWEAPVIERMVEEGAGAAAQGGE